MSNFSNVVAGGDTFVEPGDSGGPGFISDGVLTPASYLPGWDARAQRILAFLARLE